jgi:tetratricopeptide (TPR) repeat protein
MMKKHLKRVPLGTFIILTVLYFILSGFVSAETHNQPYMEVALKHLEKALSSKVGKLIHLDNARKNLELSSWDKGGHRLKAIDLIDEAKKAIRKREINRANTLIEEAIEHVKVGVGFSDEHTDDPPEVDLETNQPYMEVALEHLEKALIADTVSGKVSNLNRAKTNLELGIWDKRGNRVKALKKVDQAIILVNKNKMDKANTLIQEAIELVKKGIEKGTKKK